MLFKHFCEPLKLRKLKVVRNRGPDINKVLFKFELNEFNEYANFYEQVMYTQNI